MLVITSTLCFLLGLTAGMAHKNMERIMPLTKRGKKLKEELQKEYGAKKGEQVLYAMENKQKGIKENMKKKAMAKKPMKKSTKKTSKKK